MIWTHGPRAVAECHTLLSRQFLISFFFHFSFAGTVGGPGAAHARKLTGSELVHAGVIRVIHCDEEEQQQAGRWAAGQLGAVSVQAMPSKAHQACIGACVL